MVYHSFQWICLQNEEVKDAFEELLKIVIDSYWLKMYLPAYVLLKVGLVWSWSKRSGLSWAELSVGKGTKEPEKGRKKKDFEVCSEVRLRVKLEADLPYGNCFQPRILNDFELWNEMSQWVQFSRVTKCSPTPGISKNKKKRKNMERKGKKKRFVFIWRTCQAVSRSTRHFELVTGLVTTWKPRKDVALGVRRLSLMPPPIFHLNLYNS